VSSFPYSGAPLISAIGAAASSRGNESFSMFAGQDTRLHTPNMTWVDRQLVKNNALYKRLAFVGKTFGKVNCGKYFNEGFARLAKCIYSQAAYYHCAQPYPLIFSKPSSWAEYLKM